MAPRKAARALVAAARAGDLPALRQSFQPGCVFAGRTPLHEAAANGHTDVVRWLAARGEPVDAPDGTGRTPVHEAACFGHVDVLRALLDAGADADATKRTDWTPLMLGAEKQHSECVVLLLECGASPHVRNKDGWTAVHMAARVGCLPALHALADAAGEAWCSVSRNNRTPLHTAALHGQLAAVNAILDRLADARSSVVHQADKSGRTALLEAAGAGHLDVLRALVHAGARVDVANVVRQNALHLAALEGHAHVIAELTTQHALDPAAADQHGLTPLHAAALRGRVVAVQALVAAGAPVDARTEHGLTPLMIAANWGQAECVRELLAAGADPAATASDGSTALSRAARDAKEVYELLRGV